ncbi:exopolyphosphatase PRUNE1-like [Drosophila obscura]|uniref:exopolyphosphatase PRUNE1-like n=1 Tax=Drosophila obscura TaxID=7282 RepID=UPI001BB1ED0B|nr:exopolyphosphatase PRUNE1-like [Drosophila obscura]
MDDKRPHRSDKILDFLSYLLATQRLKFWQPQAKRSNVVKYICLSDVSCDMDSVMSTLALAYYRYRTKKSTFEHYVPMLNMRRRDFETKTEVAFMLNKWNIYAPHHLLFRDDIKIQIMKQCHYILVNHHVSSFNCRVVECYDHRPFRSDEVPLPVGCRRDLSLLPMRSCAGMITALYKNAAMECQVLYDLLRTALLIANCNFVQVLPEKLCEVPDLEMLKYLETYILGKPMEPDERALDYQKLINSMFDGQTLNLDKLLRREFKVLRASDGQLTRRLVFTSFPMALTMLVNLSRAQMAVAHFGHEQAADFILLVSTAPGLAENETMAVQQLGLISMDGLRDLDSRRLFDHMVINLNASADPMIILNPFPKLDFMQGAFYRLDKLDKSVHEVLRLVERIMYHWAEDCHCVTADSSKKPCF